jgi:DNA adenine methylase
VNAPKRPVLRYFGGKFRIRNWVTSFFPPHRIYVEPFGGAGSVLLAKAPSFAEVYNDLDGEVVNLFRVLRDPKKAKRLRALLELTPFSRAEFELSYQPSKDPVESARRLVTRCFLGFGADAQNAGRRTGFRGKGWRMHKTAVHDWQTYAPEIDRFAARLRNAVIENRPAADLIVAHDHPETLFYVDPPYVKATRSPRSRQKGSVAGYRHDLEDSDHRSLATLLRGVRGMVVLSGYPSPLYEELFAGWERHDREALADGGLNQAASRRSRTEVLWLNPACSAALRASKAQLEIA